MNKDEKIVKLLQKGYTNKTFLAQYGEKFVIIQEKRNNNFNHRLNYEILNKLKFVPKLLSNNDKFLEWEYIEGSTPQLSSQNLIKIAHNLKKLHNSNLTFPKSNLKERQEYYLEQAIALHSEELPIELIQWRKFAKNLYDNFDDNCPIHADIWPENILERTTDKALFFIDWEFSVLLDKHWDLAYFMDSAYLNDEQKKVFLDAYKNYDDAKLNVALFLVNYITVAWLMHFENYKEMFPYQELINNMYRYKSLISI